MYAWYRIENNHGKRKLIFENESALAGAKNGVIAHALQLLLKPEDHAPLGWSVPIAEKWNKKDYALIIDLKPDSKEIFLCELLDVFGFSQTFWTPIMLRLKIVYFDIETDEFDKDEFFCQDKTETVYSMLYLYGSINNGEITGSWQFPDPSPTNALLVWPEALSYFVSQAKQVDPLFQKPGLGTSMNLQLFSETPHTSIFI